MLSATQTTMTPHKNLTFLLNAETAKATVTSAGSVIKLIKVLLLFTARVYQLWQGKRIKNYQINPINKN